MSGSGVTKRSTWGGRVRVNSDSKPQQFVVSEPPEGYRKITNIYYNIELGEVEVEYEES